MPLVNVTPGDLANIRQMLGRDTTPPPPARRRPRGDGSGGSGVSVRKNSTGSVLGPRAQLNLIEGTGITITIADDAGNGEVDVTITGTAAGFVKGKLDGSLSFGGSATLSVWAWNGSAEADTGSNLTVYDWLLVSGQSIAAGTQVAASYDVNSGRYYVTGAQWCV